MVKSTVDPSPMFPEMMLGDSLKAISSAGFSAGRMHSTSPVGEIAKSGPDHAPANPSVLPGDKAAALTTGISGLRGFGSSASVALTLSLANRLKERLGSDGSIEYS